MKNILLIFLLLFTSSWAFAQIESDEEEDDSYEEVDSEDEDDEDFEYYYDWDMSKYSLGLNLNSLLSFRPSLTLTHDIGLSDYQRIAIETSYIPGFIDLEQQGFKLRGTYQYFFFKDQDYGLYSGFGVNFASLWEPYVETVFLEDTYWRTYKEVRNQTFIAGLAEVGGTVNFGEGYLLELTLGLGVGYRRVGGSYVIIDNFRWEGLFERRDPGNYMYYPAYFNMSFSIPVIRMDLRE